MGLVAHLIQQSGPIINRFDPSFPDCKAEFWLVLHFSKSPRAIPANGLQHMERCMRLKTESCERCFGKHLMMQICQILKIFHVKV